MSEILTSAEIWKDFDAEKDNLNVKQLNEVITDGIATKAVYFTGRTFGETESRVYAEICQKTTKSTKPAVLLIDDFSKPINHDELVFWAKNGFVAMSVDFVGEQADSSYTLYPEQVSYANNANGVSIYNVDNGVANTRLYEYAVNARRAITYLLAEENVQTVSVLSVGEGYKIGAMVLAFDDRVSNGAVVLGALSDHHPDESLQITGEDMAEVLAKKDRAQVWMAGLAPQSYNLHITKPVYVVGSANSVKLNTSELCRDFERLNDQSRLLVLPTAMDYVPDDYVVDIVRFMKGTPSVTDLDLTITCTDGEVTANVTTNTSRRNVSVWYCRDITKNGKHWLPAMLKTTEEGYSATLEMCEENCEGAIFAIADSDISVSTAVIPFKATNQLSLKKSSNILYAGTSVMKFLPYDFSGKWHGKANPISQCEGYLGIKGTKGNSIATLALCDKSVRYKLPLTLSFDVCCNVKQTMTVVAVTGFGSQNERYLQQIQLVGDGKWQKIVVEQSNFRDPQDLHLLSAEEKVDLIAFCCDEDFIINNICLV